MKNKYRNIFLAFGIVAVLIMIFTVILFFILGSEFFINYKMIFRGSKKEVH